jgi:multiple sugar transport system substrate-binding protein
MLMLFMITGCGNQTIIDNRYQVTDFEEHDKKQIVIWHTYSEEETKVFENVLIPMFEQEHPDIDIKPVRQSYTEELKTAIISHASANKPPDVVRMDIAWLPTFANLGLLYPVSNFHDFEEVKATLYEEPLQSNFFNGAYYGLPLNTNTKVSIYNRDLFKKTGLKEPPKTMSELIDLVEKNGLVIGMSGLTPWESLPYFFGLGGQLTDATYSRATGYLDSEESIKAVHKMLELFRNGNLTPKLLSGNADTWQGVLNGHYFMIDEGPWFYSIHSLDDTSFINEKTTSAPFPVAAGRGSVLGGENLVITRGTKHPEEAWTFVKWMTTETPQKLMLKMGLIPTNKNVDLTFFFQRYPYYQSYVESIDTAFLRPPVPQWNRMDEIYSKYFKLIFSESVTVEEGLKEAAKEIDKLLLQKK